MRTYKTCGYCGMTWTARGIARHIRMTHPADQELGVMIPVRRPLLDASSLGLVATVSPDDLDYFVKA